MTKKQTRRQFLHTAAGLLLGGIVKAETPVEVEDIQAVPLMVEINVTMHRLIDAIDAVKNAMKGLEVSMYNASLALEPDA